jgi:hypothetical protein
MIVIVVITTRHRSEHRRTVRLWNVALERALSVRPSAGAK